MRNYQTKSNQGALPDSITSTRFGAGEFNSVAVELEGAVTTSGQTLAPADGTGEVTDQLAMALAIYGAGGATYHVDTGAVNAYVLTPISPKESPNAYFNGFSVVFEPGTVNSTASTVNIGGLGVKSITLQNGTALSGGEISGTCCLKYNLGNDRFELIYSSDSFLSISNYYEIDATQADQGATSTNSETYTIYDVATLVGTSKFATIHLSHNPVAGNQTLYTFDTSLDLSTYQNLCIDFDPGAQITRTTGDEVLTVSSPENILAGKKQKIFNADMIDFGVGGVVYADWYTVNTIPGTTDMNLGIQYAYNSLARSTGGEVVLFPMDYYSSGTITIGNGSVGTYSTLAPVKIRGTISTGLQNPINGTRILYDGSSALFDFVGPLDGWGLEDFYIFYTGTSTSSIGVKGTSINSGTMRNVGISFIRGTSVQLTTEGTIATSRNVFDRLTIFLPDSSANAVGLELNGLSGGVTNTTVNTFLNTMIQPSLTTHTCIKLGYCDTNAFINTSLGAGFETTNGILLDFSVDSDFPVTNNFWQLALEQNRFNFTGSPSYYPYVPCNRVYGLGQDSTVPFPYVSNIPVTVDRIKLASDMTFSVATTGSDTTGTGIPTGNPFATVSHAYRHIAKHFDLNGYTATIQIEDGTYTDLIDLDGLIPNGLVVIQGNSSDSTAVVISTTASNAVEADNGAIATIKDMTIQTTTSGDCLNVINNSNIYVDDVIFGSCASVHIDVKRSGIVNIPYDYTISGSAPYHWLLDDGGQLFAKNIVVTYTGTPNFSGYFAIASRLSLIDVNGTTYSGTGATGTRYLSQVNSVISTGGATLPGDVAGSTATGGQYD